MADISEVNVSIQALEQLANDLQHHMNMLQSTFEELKSGMTTLGNSFCDSGYDKLYEYISSSHKMVKEGKADADIIAQMLKLDAAELRRMFNIM